MGWIVTVECDGLNEKLDTLADSAADLRVPLRIFGGYLKKRATERYKAQAFAPLAASTIEKREQRGLRVMEGKLAADLRKATRRAREKAREAGEDEQKSLDSRGIRNRKSVLEAFRQKYRHGLLAGMAGAQALTIKQAASLSARTERQVKRTAGRPILGGLDRSLVVEVGDGTVSLKSATYGEWSEVQNEGGSVGHGATLPARTVVKLEGRDIEVFKSILKSQLLMPFEEGLHGPGF